MMSEHNHVELNKSNEKFSKDFEKEKKMKKSMVSPDLGIKDSQEIKHTGSATHKKIHRGKNNNIKKLRGVLIFVMVITFVSAIIVVVAIFFSDPIEDFAKQVLGKFNVVSYSGDDCTDIKESFLLIDACNLNGNELRIGMKRGSDRINLIRIKYRFQPSNSLWKIDGNKCLDVRLEENKYGNYCSLIEEEDFKNYIFNLSLGKQETAKVTIEEFGRSCELDEIVVRESC